MGRKDESLLNLLVECPWWVSVLLSGLNLDGNSVIGYTAIELRNRRNPDCSALERLKTPIGFGGIICLAEQNLPITSSTQSIPIKTL